MKLDHIGIAVHDLQKAKKVYELLLNQLLDEVIDLPAQQIQTILVETKNTHIELLQPLGEEGAIAKFLEKRKRDYIIFIHPNATNGTLIELCEKPPSL
jgi:methylmalonyl-CoA/ethylmalonyl-CoA epimerase